MSDASKNSDSSLNEEEALIENQTAVEIINGVTLLGKLASEISFDVVRKRGRGGIVRSARGKIGHQLCREFWCEAKFRGVKAKRRDPSVLFQRALRSSRRGTPPPSRGANSLTVETITILSGKAGPHRFAPHRVCSFSKNLVSVCR